MPEILDEIIENLETESGFLIHVNSDELDREIINILNFFTNKKIENVLFTLGSSNLIEMGDEVKQIIRLTKNQGFVFVDSLEGLFIDNKQNDVSKFLRSIIV